MKTTSGQWRISLEKDGTYIVGDRYVAQLLTWYRSGSQYEQENNALKAELEANANLLVAAKDLLEACQASLDRFGGVRPDDFAKASQIEYDQLRSAIAKATGGAQ